VVVAVIAIGLALAATRVVVVIRLVVSTHEGYGLNLALN